MKFTLFFLLFLSIVCATEVPIDSLIALKSEGKLAELEKTVEILVVDSTLSSEQVELPLFYLIETKAKLNKMKELPPLMKRYITTYPNSDSLSRVYYIAAIYSAKRKNYVSAIKACDRGLAVVLSSDTTTRSLLLKTCKKLVERLHSLEKTDEVLAFSTTDALKSLLVSRQEFLKEKAMHPMAGYPDGGYVTFQDFKDKNAIDVKNVSIHKSEDKYESYRKYSKEDLEAAAFVGIFGFGKVRGAVPDYVPQLRLHIDDGGYVRRWKKGVHGKLYAYVMGGQAYILKRNRLEKLHVFNNYSWFNDRYKGLRVINMETGEVKGLSDKYLRELLKANPELLKKYENDKRKNRNRLKHLESFLKETNPTYKSYYPKGSL